MKTDIFFHISGPTYENSIYTTKEHISGNTEILGQIKIVIWKGLLPLLMLKCIFDHLGFFSGGQWVFVSDIFEF